jgi:hypothetical protein
MSIVLVCNWANDRELTFSVSTTESTVVYGLLSLTTERPVNGCK